jgi:hypothetical protein
LPQRFLPACSFHAISKSKCRSPGKATVTFSVNSKLQEFEHGAEAGFSNEFPHSKPQGDSSFTNYQYKLPV